MLNAPRVKKRFMLIFLPLLAIYILVMINVWKNQDPFCPVIMVHQRFNTSTKVRRHRLTDGVVEAPVTLFMRMTGLHIKRFYCDFLRTAVLFWPASYGKLVLVFDQESSLDHKLAKILERQFDQFFPYRKLEILYEPLPMNYKTLLKLPWPKRDTGYNRQIWSSFFNDLYTNDTVIAWVDSDTAFSTSVTRNSMYNGTRLRVIGTDCTLLHTYFARRCAQSVEVSIGLPAVADFMLHFPIYIYRDTYANCREYLIRRYKARNFEEVYRNISAYDLICPVTTILNYAWHFERNRYDWSLKICTAPLDEYNKRFQPNATIRPYDIQPVMAAPQSSVHTGDPGSAFDSAQLILASYCLSHKAAGHHLAFCTGKRDLPLSNNLILFKYARAPLPCNGDLTCKCLEVLQRHHNLVGSEIFENKRRMEWSDVEIVQKLVKEIGATCPVIGNGRPGGEIPIV
ncbi:Hypothetical predicted protein [Paramuricea clavata]|uniref:Uncharacterized protein n=1 Tax=Paramuricea clavata TaxID=317549 RepID=A0A6S7HKC5_PARCT|nr:Hypothetical predicted protein [Paramuricea clavata]